MSERDRRRVTVWGWGWGRVRAGLALVLGLAACGGGAQTGFVAMNPPPRPLRSRAVADVVLVVDHDGDHHGDHDGGQADGQAGQTPGRPQVEVGLIEVLGDDDWGAAEQAAAREALRRRGADIGCDAVALLGEIAWIDAVESSRASRVRHGYRGVCIAYP